MSVDTVRAHEFHWHSQVRWSGVCAHRYTVAEFTLQVSCNIGNMWCRLYKQLQRDKKGLPGLTHTHRKLWEAIIEAACRAGNTEWALQVSHYATVIHFCNICFGTQESCPYIIVLTHRYHCNQNVVLGSQLPCPYSKMVLTSH